MLYTGSGLFGLNEWVHVVGIVDTASQLMSVYVNGNLVDTVQFPAAAILSGNYPLRIGGPFFTLGDQTGFDGLIDEVRI